MSFTESLLFNSIFVSGNDVNAAGYDGLNAVYWKNGNLTLLPRSEINSFANSIYVLGSDVYVAGYETDLQVSSAVYWKDGIEAKLTNGTESAIAASIFVK